MDPALRVCHYLLGMLSVPLLRAHELADGSVTVAEIGLLLIDTLGLRQDQETFQTSDVEEAQKPRAPS